MTTLAQVERVARQSFAMSMRRRGFAAEKGFCFWRKRGPLFDLLIPRILTGGELLRIHVTIWSPWVDSEDGEFREFPPSSFGIGGILGEDFPERRIAGEHFDISDEAKVGAALAQILKLVDQRVMPWFESVDSYERYASYIQTAGYQPSDEHAALVGKRVKLGFELEKYR